jgi:hypothetical protein
LNNAVMRVTGEPILPWETKSATIERSQIIVPYPGFRLSMRRSLAWQIQVGRHSRGMI